MLAPVGACGALPAIPQLCKLSTNKLIDKGEHVSNSGTRVKGAQQDTQHTCPLVSECKIVSTDLSADRRQPSNKAFTSAAHLSVSDMASRGKRSKRAWRHEQCSGLASRGAASEHFTVD